MLISPLGQNGETFGSSGSPFGGSRTPLILDQFTFDDAQLETPESLGDLGGTQSIAEHKFPGGTITHKSFGYFPAVQKWRAKFFGSQASDRAEGVKRILAAGREVKLQYATRAWLGRVARFSPTAKHAWHFEYELEFWPRLDYGSPGPTLPPPTDLGTMLALHMLALESLLKYGLDPRFAFQAVAVFIGGPIGTYLSLLESSLSSAGGSITNIEADVQTEIYKSSLAALAACSTYQDSLDPTQSSPAADAASRIKAIQNLMTSSQPPVAVIETINPNLPLLASRYYGNAAAWRTIAAANGLSDTQPIGSYTLTIPKRP